MRVELIPKRIISRHRLTVFLVAAVSFLVNNFTAFLIVDSFIDEYMLIASTGAIVTLYICIFSSSSLYVRSDAWTMETCDIYIICDKNRR